MLKKLVKFVLKKVTHIFSKRNYMLYVQFILNFFFVQLAIKKYFVYVLLKQYVAHSSDQILI